MKPAGGSRVIGLTGGIATGKSSVARILQELGFPVVDADDLAREVVCPGSACLRHIAGFFGQDILLPDGALDRKRLGGIVFADSEKRRELERIVHPEIRHLARERVAEAQQGGQGIVFYMAPLLIEAGACELVDEIWVVTLRPEIQVERLMKRDGLTPEAARRIIGSQMPLEEKARYGRVVIDNSGTPEELQRLVQQITCKECNR